MLAFGLRGDVRVVEPGSAKGSKHLSSDLLWSTHDSVMHAVWFYSLWECILTSKCSRRSCPRRLLPLIFCVLPYSGNQKRKTHRIWPTLFWGPGPLRSSPMVRVRVGVRGLKVLKWLKLLRREAISKGSSVEGGMVCGSQRCKK